MKRIPVLATLVVLAAVALMIGLGIWQIDRLHQKQALIARYAAADRLPPIGWPTIPLGEDRLPLFRHATANCLSVADWRNAPGQSDADEPGFLVIADCRSGAEGPGLAVELGWTKDPNGGRQWKGGLVSGVIGPDRLSRMRLHADQPGPGLAASAPPSLDSIPNHHLQYVFTWFAFSIIALLIYALALRRRWKTEDRA